MSGTRVFALTLLAMVAFASNSLLCRLALRETRLDAASFTAIRIASGALALWLIVLVRGGPRHAAGSWRSATALFAYAAGFSFAYLSLSAGTGALLLFGAVQATMIGYALFTGERFRWRQAAGLLAAFGGLVFLLLPGISAPPLAGSLLMLAAGVAWGVYSLRGRGAGDPTLVTAANFLRAAVLAAALLAVMSSRLSLEAAGVWYAVSSGALASGVGYAIWYTALRGLKTTSAATVQLSVPVIAAAGGVVFLQEHVTTRLLIAATAVLGGIALVVVRPPRDVRLVQPRSEADWLRARGLVEDYAAFLGLDLSFQNFAQEVEHLAIEYGPPHGAFLIAEEGRVSLGCVGMRRFSDGVGEVKRLYVVPAARGRGIGRLLAESIVAAGKDLGYTRLLLDTLPTMVEAQSLYASLGFRPTTEYRFNPVPGTVFMELELR
jgi:drug/metabolite transporter (DMT)-like permease/GNAT superfamily N-acetyltransferase